MLTLTQLTVGQELLALYGAPGGAASDSVNQEFLELAEAIPGQPGEDYPVYSQPPDTSFTCGDKIEVRQQPTVRFIIHFDQK